MNICEIPVTLVPGDGIGPELTNAVRNIIKASQEFLNVRNLEEDSIKFEEVIIGEKLYSKGFDSGIDDDSWRIIMKNKVMLKAPITTPTGGGYKSLNVTLRKKLGLFANVRPSVSYYPIIEKSPKQMDLVIIRENEEDLYSGIEYRQTNNAFTSLKLLTKEGSLKICQFAFEYARANKRKKVTCMIKDNIMKISDGMFYSAFLEVAKNYPDIQNERYIIDIGSARIAARPNVFDVIVTENLYGDIISDIASEISGSVGLAGSANIGEEYAMFEAIHGSAPLMAGQNRANPSAFLNGAILMLKHMGLNIKANLIEEAYWKTLEDGVHTADIYKEGYSIKKVGTIEFSEEVIKRFGQKSNKLHNELDAFYEKEYKMKNFQKSIYKDFLNEDNVKKKLVGFDFFIDTKIKNINLFAQNIQNIIKECDLGEKIKISSILSKGLKVWPVNPECENNMNCEDDIYDYWMLRFMFIEDKKINKIENHELLKILNHFYAQLIEKTKFDIIKVENLYFFISEEGAYQGFSAGQGE
jgi:isocitrate dehydrogenase